MTHLILGHRGEVGSALLKLFVSSAKEKVMGVDFKSPETLSNIKESFDVVHVCIPYGKDFISEVTQYSGKAKLTIIHSTVPIGTSRSLGAVHSPIRGVHPNLFTSLQVFTKFFGGEYADLAAQIFREHGIKTVCVPDPEQTEAMKLWETEQYRRFILLSKEIWLWCKEHRVDFDLVYTKANETYNEGYHLMGMDHVARPVLRYVAGPIGGHCVEANHKLLFPPENGELKAWRERFEKELEILL